MGKSTCNKSIPSNQFFFALIRKLNDDYPIVFSGTGKHKPHSLIYTDFKKKWGAIDTLYSIAEKKIEKIKEIYQEYLNDYFTLLSYIIEEGEMQEEEDKYQENIRKAKKGGR